MAKDPAVQLAKLVAKHLRGEIAPKATYPFCDIGWPECKCGTCGARHKGASSGLSTPYQVASSKLKGEK